MFSSFHNLLLQAMSPSAIQSQKVSELVDSGVKHAIAHTAPSLASNGSPTALAELDASRLIFTRNPNPQPVPEPNSPEVMAMNTYEATNPPGPPILYPQVS